MAVFFTPAMISGTLRMKCSPLVAWDVVVGIMCVLSVGPAALTSAARWPAKYALRY
jgi:hypothetical protein